MNSRTEWDLSILTSELTHWKIFRRLERQTKSWTILKSIPRETQEIKMKGSFTWTWLILDACVGLPQLFIKVLLRIQVIQKCTKQWIRLHVGNIKIWCVSLWAEVQIQRCLSLAKQHVPWDSCWNDTNSNEESNPTLTSLMVKIPSGSKLHQFTLL